MEYSFGNMILKTLKAEGIRERDLYNGLCTNGAFTRYMRGERYVDRLLMTALLQRLGRSADKFYSLLTREEYDYFIWQQKVELAQMHGRWEEIDSLLREPEAEDESCNAVLQRQFTLIMRAIVEEKCRGNGQESRRLLKKAVSLTVPDFAAGEGICENTRLGTQEIHAMLLWLSFRPDSEAAHQKAFRLLGDLINNIEANYVDRQEKCRIYPKAVALYLPLLNERDKYYASIELAKKALELIASTGYAADIKGVLKGYVKAAEALKAAELEEVRNQLWTWEQIGLEYTAEGVWGNELWTGSFGQEIELLHEMISRSRQEKGYTQEQLGQDICEPVTISRIENGRSRPHPKNYQALAKKLSLPEEYYYSTIKTGSLDILALRWEYEVCVIKEKWGEAESLLERLENSLDLSAACNRQYIEQAKYILDKHTGSWKERSVEENVGRLLKILSYSIPDVPKEERAEKWPEKFWKHVFTEREMSLLMHVADAWSLRGQYEPSVYILEKILKYYESSEVKLEFHHRTIELIYQRMSFQYAYLGHLDKQLEYSEKGIQYTVFCSSKRIVSVFLNNKADALEQEGETSAALRYYKMAYYCAKFFGSKGTEAVAKRSYEKLCHEVLK